MADLKEYWEVHFKGMNYLLIAHAAGLVTCLTLLKDYDTTPKLKGVGAFVWLFGVGLISAIVAGSGTSSMRMMQLVGRTEERWKRRLVVLSALSYVLLIAAIIVAIVKFGNL